MIFGQEKRAAPRHKVLKDGKIVTMNHWSVVDCCVKDISESGARIKCQDQAAVPSEFRLLIPTRRTIRDARVVWRQGDLLGLQFIADTMTAPAHRW